MAARNRLELCSSREFELQQARDDFLEVSLNLSQPCPTSLSPSPALITSVHRILTNVLHFPALVDFNFRLQGASKAAH
jgi:hypothetical protein